MANTLDKNLEGKRVTFKEGVLIDKYAGQSAIVKGGFGANPDAKLGYMGGKLYVKFDDGVECALTGMDVLAIV